MERYIWPNISYLFWFMAACIWALLRSENWEVSLTQNLEPSLLHQFSQQYLWFFAVRWHRYRHTYQQLPVYLTCVFLNQNDWTIDESEGWITNFERIVNFNNELYHWRYFQALDNQIVDLFKSFSGFCYFVLVVSSNWWILWRLLEWKRH